MKTRKYKASFTLEAAVVMSSILIILCAILYAFMIMYQNVIVTYATSYGAQQGASTWANNDLKVDGLKAEEKSDLGLYYRIAEFGRGGNVPTKEDNIKECVIAKLHGGVFSAGDENVKVEFKNYVLQRQINVKVNQKIPIPFGGIVKFFRGGKDFEISTTATAVIPEPTEYIRNCDYAVETATSLIEFIDKKLGVSDGFEKFKSAIANAG